MKTGKIHEIGGESKLGISAKGRTINIPLNVYRDYNEMGYGDDEYLMLMDQVIVPVLKEFSPDLCVISSGYDAAIGDKMGSFRVTPIGYGLMTRMVMNAVGNGKVGLILEGGYNLCTMPRSIACCIHSCLVGKTDRNLNLEQYENEFIEMLGDGKAAEVFDEWKLFQRDGISEQHLRNNRNEIDAVMRKIKDSHKDFWRCFK